MVAAGTLVWLLPRPGAVDPAGWRLLAIFVGTVAGMLLQPLAIGAMALLGVTLAILARAVTLQHALAAYGAPVMWIIVAAFLLSRAIVETGLGRRVALLFVRWFGSSSLRLGYALAGADVLVAPVIPSDTARVGGVIFPITQSLAESYESRPGPTARKLGAYLMQCAYHVGCTTSALFLTSMAANLVAAEFAFKYAGVQITWLNWIAASCVPAAVSIGLLPWLIYRLDPPELKQTPEAQMLADDHLRAMGSISSREKNLLVILVAMLCGWAAQPWHGFHAVVVAFAGLCLIVLTRVMRWEELLKEHRAWDALIWLGGLMMMADGLNTLGVTRAFTDALSARLAGWTGIAALILVIIAYCYIHYTFASMTAQITALYPSFLMLAVGAGAPPLVSALSLAFFSCMNASLTHYGTAPGPIFFGAGYVSQTTWWRVGFFVMAANLFIWLAVGFPWWRVIGFW